MIGECLPRHRHEEFLKFPRRLDRGVPKNLSVHLIVDTYTTHKHSHVNAWLIKYPCFHLDFTSTSSPWLNLVERWFREITDRAMQQGVCCSMPDPWDPRGRSKADLR